MTNEEIRIVLTEKFGFEIGDFIIIAKSKDDSDLKYVFSGPPLIISGLLSWFGTHVNISGFSSNYKEDEEKQE